MTKVGLKEVLDPVFKDVVFDKKFYRKIRLRNIEFITKNEEHRNFFGGQLIGCFPVSYQISDQLNLFEDVFEIDQDTVKQAVSRVTSIPGYETKDGFKISSDPVNVSIVYGIHSVLNSPKLNPKEKKETATELLYHFSIRTLSVLISNYYLYPLSENEAISLFERLSNRYLIKQMNSWSDYCRYRADEYMKSKFVNVIKDFKDDTAIIAAINDLFNRIKNMMKHIYREMLELKSNKSTSMGSRKNTLTNLDGKETLADKAESAETFTNYLVSTLSSQNSFIKPEALEVTVNIIKTLDYDELRLFLAKLWEYSNKTPQKYNEVVSFFNLVLTNAVEYLQQNQQILRRNSSLVTVIDKLSGNVLYARGEGASVTVVKNKGMELCRRIEKMSDRKMSGMRNAVYIYICVRAFTKRHYN